jgi:hypothetical protein
MRRRLASQANHDAIALKLDAPSASLLCGAHDAGYVSLRERRSASWSPKIRSGDRNNLGAHAATASSAGSSGSDFHGALRSRTGSATTSTGSGSTSTSLALRAAIASGVA